MPCLYIFISLGSNQSLDGVEPRKLIKRAVAQLSPMAKENTFAVSGYYETPPWPQSRIAIDPFYVNAVVGGEFSVSLPIFHETLKDLEKAFGRQPSEPFAPRALDLDILFCRHIEADAGPDIILPPKDLWHKTTLQKAFSPSDPLTVPHPRLHQRAFVLRPLMDLEPDFKHPCLGKSIAELWGELGTREKNSIKRLSI